MLNIRREAFIPKYTTRHRAGQLTSTLRRDRQGAEDRPFKRGKADSGADRFAMQQSQNEMEGKPDNQGKFTTIGTKMWPERSYALYWTLIALEKKWRDATSSHEIQGMERRGREGEETKK
uniref:Uncharacterized protein n=1 Tax=Haemonchus contortus TaxID=6289 RepID=A0A7I5EDH3_HAECO